MMYKIDLLQIYNSQVRQMVYNYGMENDRIHDRPRALL